MGFGLVRESAVAVVKGSNFGRMTERRALVNLTFTILIAIRARSAKCRPAKYVDCSMISGTTCSSLWHAIILDLSYQITEVLVRGFSEQL